MQSAPALLDVGEEKFASDSLKGFCNTGEAVGHALFRSAAAAVGEAMSKESSGKIDAELPSLCGLVNNSTLAKYTIAQPGREAMLLETLKALKLVLAADKATDDAAFSKTAESLNKTYSKIPSTVCGECHRRQLRGIQTGHSTHKRSYWDSFESQ